MPTTPKLSNAVLAYLRNVSSSKSAVGAETVSIPSGSAGDTVQCVLSNRPVLNQSGNDVGGFQDSSLVLTSTTFTNEVALNTTDLNNGEYWVDYLTGLIFGRRADSAATMIASYSILQLNSNSSSGGLVIGAYDYVHYTYNSGSVTRAQYYSGGSGGTLVATVTYGYTGSDLTSITKT